MTTVEPFTEPPLVRDPVEQLAEMFLERYRQGERPALSEFTALAPEHAEEILELFPALVLMEQAQIGTPAEGGKALGVGSFERVGDYRIIREVGRGGMGVVFEAEQETLGRRVALKVLPTTISGGSAALLRFRREARSAARLHHTNIVPVFDIGERDGVHYYAMQFIQGQSLDEVIAELRRLREPGVRNATNADTDALAKEVTVVGSASATSSFVDSLSASTRSDGHFYRSTANIALQAAEAIAYAHGQRVLHRDIKPANLLLDARGTVWVTDFGLAKEEGDDLTRTGNIVGTLRYMAPERFNGVSDAHSDVYGLGATLYELLLLRPAFAETDRVQLVKAVLHEEPARPRSLDPHIPRDLETIVLKAIAKEPGDRYASAEEMAADLRRFLADIPLVARRVPTWERVGRWCRRNPGWAATLATAITLLLVVAIGGALFSAYLGGALHDLQISREQETEQLWQAHLERARALRSSNRVGQRFQALAAIREAAKIKVTRALRDEAVAALVLPDVEVAHEWEGWPAGSTLFCHDSNLRSYARIDGEGVLTICRVLPGAEGIVAKTQTDRPTRLHRLRMSPDGRFVAFARPGDGALGNGYVKVWRVGNGELSLCREIVEQLSFQSIAFQGDGRRLAIGRLPGTIDLVDLETNEPTRTLVVRALPRVIAFDPQGTRLAAACGDSIRILDIETGTIVAKLSDDGINTWMYGLAWRPDGRVLAATSEDIRIHLWDVERAVEIATPMAGHTGSGITMAFNRRGDRLISTGWDEETRLWDVVSGQLLLTMPGRFGAVFGPDDTTIGIETAGTKLRIWRVADGRELRRLRRREAERNETVTMPVFHPRERVLATMSNRGLAFFDLDTGNELGFSKFANVTVAYPKRFDPEGGWLTCGRSGAAVWPTMRDPARPDTLRVGPPRRLASAVDAGMDATPDGRFRVVPRGNHAIVMDRNRGEARTVLYPHTDVRYCAISPDGMVAATFSWHNNGLYTSARIWNAQSGKHIVDLPVRGSMWGGFSPNGRWLTTFSTTPIYQIWDTATWRPIRPIPGSGTCWANRGGFLAVNEGLGQIAILDPASGEEVLRLTGPDSQVYHPGFFTANDGQLVSGISDARQLYVWDLSLIGKQVRAMGLEFHWPEAERDGSSKPAVPVRKVEVDLGDWLVPEEARADTLWDSIQKGGRDWIRSLQSRGQPGSPATREPR